MTDILPVIIVGGGPAGMVAGLLLARAGVAVTVLEKHGDFLRDFRGDTVHPSTLEIFHELGLLDALLKLPHARMDRLSLNLFGRPIAIGDLSHLPVAAPFIAMMPQWDLLDFIADHAKVYPAFTLRMNCEATGVTSDGDGRISGVTTVDGETLPARLVIAADGRRSILRAAAQLPLVDLGAPMDVLWFRIVKPAGLGMGEVPLGTVQPGRMLVAIDRGEYWQTARIIPKGGFDAVQAAGLDAFRTDIAELVPEMAVGLASLTRWDDVKLLSVSLDRLTRWHRPGLLAIGDAAHAMSPIGGVGINLAVQDAVAAANVLAAALVQGDNPDPLLQQVQARRWRATRWMQAIQAAAQRRVLLPLLEGQVAGDRIPLPIRLLDRFPLLRRIPARIIGLGFGRQHVTSPLAKEFE